MDTSLSPDRRLWKTSGWSMLLSGVVSSTMAHAHAEERPPAGGHAAAEVALAATASTLPPEEALEAHPAGRIAQAAIALGGESRLGLVYGGAFDPGWAGAGIWLGLEGPLLERRSRLRLRFGASPLGWETTVTASMVLWSQARGRLTASLSPSLTVGAVLAEPSSLPLLGLGGLGSLRLGLGARWAAEVSLQPEWIFCPGYQAVGQRGYVGLDVPVLVGFQRTLR